MKYTAFLLAAILATTVSVPAFAGNYDWRHERRPQMPPVSVDANLAKVNTTISSTASSGNNSICSQSKGGQNTIVTGDVMALVTSEVNVNALGEKENNPRGININANLALVNTRLNSVATSGNNTITSSGTTTNRHYHHSTGNDGSNYIGTGSAGVDVMSVVNVNRLGI